jgi:6-phosphogluconolactonase (cycloisomerase 2 family)
MANGYPVSVTVSGLLGSGLVIQNNFSDSLSVTASGEVRFAQPVPTGSAYDVSVLTQPGSPTQACTVANGSGTVNGAAVSTPTITCVTQVAQTLYSLNYGDGTLSFFTIDATTGQPRARGNVQVSGAPIDITGDGQGRFLYVLSSYNGILGVQAANSLPIPGSPFPVGSFATSLTGYPGTKTLYAVNAGSNDITGYAIDQTTGTLTALPGSPFKAGTNPRKLTVDSAGRFAYVTNGGSNDVFIYAVDPTTGALTQSSRAYAGTQPFELLLHRTGKFAYVANTGSANISGYLVDAKTGELSQLAGSPFVTSGVPGDTTSYNGGRAPMLLHPNGKLLFVRSTTAKTISVFTIDPTSGGLTAAQGSPHTTGDGAVTQALDATGRFLFVANHGSAPGPGSISVFAVNTDTGAMTEVAGSPFALAGGPAWVSPDPSGNFLYAAGSNSVIYSMKVDPDTGVLTPLSSGATVLTGDTPIVTLAVPGLAQPGAATFRSKFAYVPNADNTISGYAIDPTSGALTPAPNSPFPSKGTGLSAVAVAAGGKFAYSTNTGSNNVTLYDVDPTTGAFTPQSSFGLSGSNPTLILTDATGQGAYVVTSYSIDTYSIDPTTGLFGGILGYGLAPSALALEANGRFAFGIYNGMIESQLTSATPSISGPVSTLPVSPNASSVAVHPGGLFIYVANADSSGTIQTFSVTSTGGTPEGALAAVGAPTPAGNAPLSLAVDPTGHFLYAANSGSNNISGYSIDQSSGALTPFPGAPAAAGTHPITVTVDQSGRFLYSVSDVDRSVLTYIIDPATGALSPTGSPLVTGTSSPKGFVVTTNTEFH